MRTTNTLDRLRGGRLQSLLPQIRAFFSNGPTILVVNLLIVSGFTGYYFLKPPRGTEVVSAVIQDDIPPTSAKQLSTSLPSPTWTPFPPSPLTATPSPSPTFFASPTPTPTITPTLPSQAKIKGIKGYSQSMPLSCESRSAVDWARYFGKSINEYKFFNGLPVHSNPDKGFVGSVYGSWGQIPPNPYGVHSVPIAHRLREFGLNAKAVRHMTWEELKTELAEGKPVIVWVVGHVARGTPVPYTAAGGAVTTVARFEHTVIAIGYTENKITVLDGSRVYTRHKGEFMKSWGVLENQAVIWID
jgi:uncharacterized protein YvpB